MMISATQARLALLHAGYCPLPAVGKAVFLENWRQSKPDDEQISKWESEHPDWGNTGVLCGNVAAVDNDILDEVITNAVQKRIDEIVGAAPRLVRVGQAPKRSTIFQVAEPFSKLDTGRYIDGEGIEHHLEILCDGQQFIAHVEVRVRSVGCLVAELRTNMTPRINPANGNRSAGAGLRLALCFTVPNNMDIRLIRDCMMAAQGKPPPPRT
jgi:hypothetical protein